MARGQVGHPDHALRPRAVSRASSITMTFKSPPTSVNVLPYSWAGDVTWPASSPRYRTDEIRQADRHLGQATQEREGIVEAEIHLEARVHGQAEHEQGTDGAEEDEPLPDAPEIEMAGPRHEPGEDARGESASGPRL